MSTTLTWSPPPKEVTNHSIGYLKREMAKRFGQFDGSIGEYLGLVGEELIPFLDGIIAGNGDNDMAKDAQELIDAINKYGQVELRIE